MDEGVGMIVAKFFAVAFGFAILDITWRHAFKLPKAEGWRFYLQGIPDCLFGVAIAKLFL
jgi:hypothetical protein